MIPERAGNPPKILIVDDDEDWRRQIRLYAKLLKYDPELANNFEEVELKLKSAEGENNLFSVATIDMKFEVGKERTLSLQGKQILQYIKSEHPYIACIMISSSPVVAHEILDLRDYYKLDYYISKDKLDQDVLKRAIERAVERVRPLGNIERRREMLEQTLEIWKDICVIKNKNLALVKLQKAQKGVDVSVGIENQIETYEAELEEAEEKVRELEQEIKQLGTD